MILVQLLAFVSSSADSRRAFTSFWRNYVYIVLVKGLEGQSLHRDRVVRLNYRPSMPIAV